MSDSIVVYGFETSNNMKVRVALGYKGIPYRFETIDPADRTEVVRLSGQYLTPVLVHADRVLFDSAAILRYLDANFPDTPKLFGANRQEQWAIEEWERFARGPLAAPMMAIVHRRVSGGDVDEDLQRSAAADLGTAVQRLENGLQGREWLVGETMSAADVTAGAVIRRIRNSGVLPLPSGAESIEPWVDRVIAWDRK